MTAVSSVLKSLPPTTEAEYGIKKIAGVMKPHN